MPVIFDTGALVRPAFDAAVFTATKWNTADDKASFANTLCRFIAADFKTSLFTDKLYRRLSDTFGHIANFDKNGFIAVFFEDLRGKVDFLEQTISWRPCGDPAWTYSDVERAILRRLKACDILGAYRAMRAAEVEGLERELLRRLAAKYDGTAAESQPPILHCPVPPKSAKQRPTPGQPSLF
jgi:hypothetical protein